MQQRWATKFTSDDVNGAKNLRIPVILPVLAMILTLASCGKSESAEMTQNQQPPVVVEVLEMQPADVDSTRVLTGRAHAFAAAEIRPQVTGLIEKRLFSEGETVEAGQALYQLASSEYRAAVQSARADLAGAEANMAAARETVNRYQRLIDLNAVSRQVYDQAVAALKRSEADIGIRKAALAAAQINLGRTTVSSPISGQIGRSSVTVGALVTINQTDPLAKVFQLDPIYIDLTASSTELLDWKQDIATGAIKANEEGAVPVKLRLENGREYPHQGALEFGEVSVDEAAGTVVVRALVPNPDELLLPGMFVKAEFSGGTYEGAMLVPQKAVQRKPAGDAYVYVVGADGIATQRTLSLQGSVDSNWIVLEGLEVGDKVIVAGLQSVREGAVVQINEPNDSFADTLTGGSDKAER